MPSVTINQRAVERLRSGHLWIYSSDVTDRHDAQPGDVVRVLDGKRKTYGVAHFSAASQITLRLLSTRIEEIDQAWFRQRLERALTHRRRLYPGAETFRLVFGEGDLLPALIVDKYEDVLTVQALNQGMDQSLPHIVAALQELLQPRGILARNDASVREKEDLERKVEVMAGEIPEEVTYHLNGLTWHADLRSGQKTGAYLDQRENHAATARYAHGRALDCFTSGGGFALTMAAQCESVEAVDSGAAVLSLARGNAAANNIGNVHFREADVFDFLQEHSASRHTYDTIVLDPPAFTKGRAGIEGALRGYKEINQRALRMLNPGGVLVTCSCSQHISEADLLGVLADAALDARRTLRVLERRTQALDHPILLTVPETHYLKCLLFEVL